MAEPNSARRKKAAAANFQIYLFEMLRTTTA
jgi:hypothetical protein